MGQKIKNINLVFPEDGFFASPALKKDKKAYDLLKETFSGKTIKVDVSNVSDDEIVSKLKDLSYETKGKTHDKKESLKFCIDFDGTCVTEEFPEVGDDVPGATRVLKKLVDAGHKLILWTARSEKTLDDAINWFECRHIPLYGVNNDPTPLEGYPIPRKVVPSWFIDDRNLGTPMRKYKYFNKDNNLLEFDVVDWFTIEDILIEKGIID